MAKLRIAICGFNGRMGTSIRELEPEFKESLSFFSFRDTAGETPDVIIDFSNPEGFHATLDFCREKKVPLVSGTTGLQPQQKQSLESLGAQIPVLWDANMSLGVQWLLRSLECVKTLPRDFNIQVEETHHKHKVDAPSGTALEIQKVLQANRSESLPAPLSIRGGGVFGQHRVMMMGEEEVIVFDHNVLSRKVFARGAITAALWLHGQPKGFYRMRDLFEGVAST